MTSPFTVNLDSGQNTVALLNDTSGTAGTSVFVDVPESAAPTYDVPAGTPIVVADNGGNDFITADYTNGNPIPAGLTIGNPLNSSSAIPVQPSLVVTGVQAHTNYVPEYQLTSTSLAVGDPVIIDNGTPAAIQFPYGQPSNLSLFSDVVDYGSSGPPQPGTGTLEIVSGTFAFNQDLGPGGPVASVTVDSGATAIFNTSQHLNSLTVQSGAEVEMTVAGGQVLDVNDLTVDGTVALSNNDLIVNEPSDASAILSAESAGLSNPGADGTIYGYSLGAAQISDSYGYGTDSFDNLDAQYVAPGAVVVGQVDPGETDFGSQTQTSESVLTEPWSQALPDDGAVSYTVNWGDGLIDTYPGTATAITHTFYQLGPTLVQVQEADYDAGSGYSVVPLPATVVNVAGDSTEFPFVSVNGDGGPVDVTATGDDGFAVTQGGTTLATGGVAHVSILDIEDASSVTVDYSDGDPVPYGGIFANSPVVNLTGDLGGNSVVVAGTATVVGSDEIYHPTATIINDNATDTGNIIAISGQTQLSVPPPAGSADTTSAVGSELDVFPSASVVLTGSATFSTLNISSGATVRMANSTGTASLLTVGNLVLSGPDVQDNGAVLDLSNNDMIARQTPASTIEALLSAGYDGGLWDGLDYATGPEPANITSSAAAADPSSVLAVGYKQVGSETGDWAAAAFDGVAVASGDAVLKYTYYGDANLDGAVDSTDCSFADNGFDTGATGWGNGAFCYDGIVSSTDLQDLQTTFLVLGDKDITITGNFSNNKTEVTIAGGGQTQIEIQATNDNSGDNESVESLNIDSITLDGQVVAPPAGFTIAAPTVINGVGGKQVSRFNITAPTKAGKYEIKFSAPHSTNTITRTIIVTN